MKTDFSKGKPSLLLGSRQTGKPTLIESVLEGMDYLYLNGNDADTEAILTNSTAAKLKQAAGQKKIVFIDESQRIANIGLTLKLSTDQLKDIQVIAMGKLCHSRAHEMAAL